jgi:hypothetical protein
MLRPFAPLLLLLPAACASVSSGISQDIEVATDPPGAACTLSRNGEEIGRVAPTPGRAHVSKSGRAIEVSCTRAGHQPGSATVESGFQAMTLGNVLIGGVIGVAIDAGTGAMHRYPGQVSVTLPPEGAVPPPAPSPTPLPATPVAATIPAPPPTGLLPVVVVPPAGPRGG